MAIIAELTKLIYTRSRCKILKIFTLRTVKIKLILKKFSQHSLRNDVDRGVHTCDVWGTCGQSNTVINSLSDNQVHLKTLYTEKEIAWQLWWLRLPFSSAISEVRIHLFSECHSHVKIMTAVWLRRARLVSGWAIRSVHPFIEVRAMFHSKVGR